MKRLVSVALVALTAPLLAAPVPKVSVNQWLIAMDGSLFLFTEGDKEPRKLTDGTGLAKSGFSQPLWSPDGRRIAFSAAAKDGGYHIFTMDADGKNIRQITRGETPHYAPNWSPDGERLAFYRDDPEVNSPSEICTVNAKDGKDLKAISNLGDYNPAFSPDGKTIVFISNRGEYYHLYTMDADGDRTTKLIGQSVFSPVVFPAWSPDGKQITFALWAGTHEEGGAEICVVQPDGKGLTVVTQFGENRWANSPSWSPDGKRISFLLDDDSENGEASCSLWVMDVNGKNRKELLRLKGISSDIQAR